MTFFKINESSAAPVAKSKGVGGMSKAAPVPPKAAPMAPPATVHKATGAGAVAHKPATTISDDDFEEF